MGLILFLVLEDRVFICMSGADLALRIKTVSTFGTAGTLFAQSKEDLFGETGSMTSVRMCPKASGAGVLLAL